MQTRDFGELKTKKDLIVSRRLPGWARRRSSLEPSSSALSQFKRVSLRPSNRRLPAGTTVQDDSAPQMPRVILALRTLFEQHNRYRVVAGDGGVHQKWLAAIQKVLQARYQLLSSHLVEALRLSAQLGIRHEELAKTVCEALQYRADITSVVLALLCLLELKLPYVSLQSTFLTHLQDMVESLEFSDLKLCLVALAHLKVADCALVDRVCNSMLERALHSDSRERAALKLERRRHGGGGGGGVDRPRRVPEGLDTWTDSRDFLVVPFCLNRLNTQHVDLLEYSAVRIRSLYVSRIRCQPLEALQALDGYSAEGELCWRPSRICDRYCRFLLREATTRELLVLCKALIALQLNTTQVWSAWTHEMSTRLDELSVVQLGQLAEFFRAVRCPTGSVLQAMMDRLGLAHSGTEQSLLRCAESVELQLDIALKAYTKSDIEEDVHKLVQQHEPHAGGGCCPERLRNVNVEKP